MQEQRCRMAVLCCVGLLQEVASCVASRDWHGFEKPEGKHHGLAGVGVGNFEPLKKPVPPVQGQGYQTVKMCTIFGC
jgi:hypothetical protein